MEGWKERDGATNGISIRELSDEMGRIRPGERPERERRGAVATTTSRSGPPGRFRLDSPEHVGPGTRAQLSTPALGQSAVQRAMSSLQHSPACAPEHPHASIRGVARTSTSTASRRPADALLSPPPAPHRTASPPCSTRAAASSALPRAAQPAAALIGNPETGRTPSPWS
ncbi:hypothetical protein BDV95DRAFT_60596 [Massariosphaeria phaeospora]|uniref:Uncharacterized protein n=1 Tax=Massariosphaeria phaeospora TaxID=100035 RepID=A0A7C8I5H7_9PLEO|nr:hypothetical protein BDV95DRAFT_60596 [Massariosphaeria phaeospora]